MARRDAELAHLTGGHDHGGLAAEDLGLGTDDVATDGGHYFSRFARSMGIGNKGNEGNGRFQGARRSVRCEPTIPFIPLTPFVPALRTQPVIFFAFSIASSMPPTM